MNAPLRFHPFVRPLVWGGRRLADVLGKSQPAGTACGESWEISDHPHHRSVVAVGPHAGCTLRDLMEQAAPALLGPAAGRLTQFPWLVKFLDACDWLSVQVHPDTETVRRLWPGEGSKTEAWFVLDAQPGSRIYAGLLPGTDEAKLRQALAEGKVADCLHSFTPRPGDCVFLPAGTVHAVGGGVLFAEVQQTSDATFRLYDWDRKDAQGRPRELHIDQSMAAIHWDRGPVTPVHAEAFTEPAEAGPTVTRQELVRCPFFELDYVQARKPFPVGGDGRLRALIVLRGQGRWRTGGAEPELATGQAWLLPASMPRVECQPESCLGALLCTLP